MELRDMTLAELLESVENAMGASVNNWGGYCKALRAELKKRCEAKSEPDFACEECGAYWYDGKPYRILQACPCPVVGEGSRYTWYTYCIKCGVSNPAHVPTWNSVAVPGICGDCQASKPDAPKGYEFVAWRDPVYGEWFLAETTGAAPIQRTVDAPWHGGKRWILRKVAEVPKCDKCGKPAKPDNIKECTWYVTPNGLNICWHCYYTRPDAPPGYEHVGEWRPPKKYEDYLDYDGTAQKAEKDFTDVAAWILRKVEEDGPATIEEQIGGNRADLISHSRRLQILEYEIIAALTRRVEKLERKHE